jgi:hypothetical protein
MAKEVHLGYRCYLTVTERTHVQKSILCRLRKLKGKRGLRYTKRALGRIYRKMEEFFPDDV